MRIIKWIAAIVLSLVALLLVIAMILPSSYSVSRTIIVKKPIQEVYTMVSDYQNWLKWNPWFSLDATVKTELSNPSTGVGAFWKWNGLKIGSGQLTTLNEVKYKSITFKLEFLSPYKMTSLEAWTFEETREGVKISWTDSGELGFPMGRFFGPFLDSKMGPDFEKGLLNIKNRCEK